jgi:hypothetical protein
MAEWRKRKYVELLNDPNVNFWLDEVGRNSKQTRQAGRHRLGLFLEWAKLDPKSFREMEKKARDELVTRFIRERENKGLLESTNQTVLRYIRSYLRYNDLELRKIPLKRTGTNSENERVPLKEEIVDILYHRKAPPRAVAEIALMAFSGLRIEVLGNFEGTDGLRVGDVSDLEIEAGKVTFKKIPARINVRRPLSKNHHKYFTFLPAEGCELLKDYLGYLVAKGEPLTPETFVSVASKRLEPRGRYARQEPHPLQSQEVSNEIRRVLHPKYSFRPYLLRAYFDTALEMAESRRAITHSQRQFWMGHVGDIETVYSTRKELSPEMVEEMRRAFTEACKFVETKGEGPLEVVKGEFQAKDKEHEEALTSVRLQNLELKDELRRMREEQAEQKRQLQGLLSMLKGAERERRRELEKPTVTSEAKKA